MIRTTYNNKELLTILHDRKDVLNTFLEGKDLDDTQLNLLSRFKSWHAGLSQLDKDIFYLITQYKVSKVARLLDCSTGFVYQKKKELTSQLNSL